jgi:hypothetical protein
VIIYFILGEVRDFEACFPLRRFVAALAIFVAISVSGGYNPARSATSVTSAGSSAVSAQTIAMPVPFGAAKLNKLLLWIIVGILALGLLTVKLDRSDSRPA